MAKFIKSTEAVIKANSKNCSVSEYPIGDKDIDLAVAVITSRYPEKGHCVNMASKELIYILEGCGAIHCENESIDFSAGDSILIDTGEKYYWETEYCKVTITCAPAWNIEQYRLIIK